MTGNSCLRKKKSQQAQLNLSIKVMEKSYSIKASYKGNMYIIKGYFPSEASLKQQIVSRNIKDLSKQSSFVIQYPEGIINLQQAYKNCEKQNKNTFKVIINKKKRSKNQSKSQQNYQNSTQLLKHLSMIDPQADHINSSIDRRSLNMQQPIQKPEQQSILVKTIPKREKPRKISQELQLENQLRNQQPVTEFGLKDFQQSEQLLNNQPELPNFQLSEILQKPPIQSQDKQKSIDLPKQTSKYDKKQKVLQIQTNFQTNQNSSKSSKKCTSCLENNLLVQTLCINCLEEKHQQNLQKMSKSLQQSIKIKIKEEIEFDVNTKVKRIENQLKKQISQLRLKSNQQQQQILHLSDQNKQLKETLRTQQKKTKLIENQANKIKLQFHTYSDIIKLFEKDFQTINQINFELQNSKIILEHRIDQLAKKMKKLSNDSDQKGQKIKSQHQQKNQDQKQIKSRQNFPEQKPGPQNIKNKNPLVHQPKNEDKKVFNQMPKQQLQRMFMNPNFPDQGKAKDQPQSDKRNIKPIDATIRQIEKVSILKVGQTYQPQINIKNTGTSKWPSQVFIFEKDSKRTKKISSLIPKEEFIFKDNVVYKGEREGQNIQIKYQVYYEEKGQKIYIGLPISIFIKVKKAEPQSILAELQEDEPVKDENNGLPIGMINEQEVGPSREQVQGFGKKVMEEVESEIKRSQAFIRMINEKKRQLNVVNQTTKSIKNQLESMEINQENFGECDSEIIDEIIKNFQVIDIIKN